MEKLNSEFMGVVPPRNTEEDLKERALVVFEGFSGRPEELILFIIRLKQLCTEDLTGKIEAAKGEISQAQVYLERLNSI